ncbi:hypothetical protein HZA86_04545 [Candidatus Uhrbacteria bacterium]|nr:hypothetical protein [Candidatus Uhrbacteria bacterium]
MCFSPKVTLATFVLEWSLAIWAWIQYRYHRFGQLAIALLVLLGFYQWSEYAICRGSNPVDWARLGFAAVGFMPAIGLHLIMLFDKQKPGRTHVETVTRYLVPIGYALASLWALVFWVEPAVIRSATCMPNFILYGKSMRPYTWFGYYYTTLIAWSLVAMAALRERTAGALRSATNWLAIGYLSFIIPTYLVIFMFPKMIPGFPSVLCGFAVILAIIMVKKVLPEYEKTHRDMRI